MRIQLTQNDYERSCTSWNLEQVARSLTQSISTPPDRLLDVGCGYGGITATLRDHLGGRSAHGIDIDPDICDEVKAKGVHAEILDVSQAPIPYPDAHFDLVMSFGMLDYLPWYDPVVAELSRVLTPSGTIAIALPNLGSWHNRVALLLGYQPRDVEFCSRQAVGLSPMYRSPHNRTPVGHIHTPTAHAFDEFMTLMGFEKIRLDALRPKNIKSAVPLRIADAILGRSASSARRFLYIGRKVADPQPHNPGWWNPSTATQLTSGE